MSNWMAQIFVAVFRDICGFAVDNCCYLLKNKGCYSELNSYDEISICEKVFYSFLQYEKTL